VLERIDERLEELRIERMKGERQLEALRQQRRAVRETVLRIAGAIQVLEELRAALAGEAVTAG
jgi:hypothetical protein